MSFFLKLRQTLRHQFQIAVIGGVGLAGFLSGCGQDDRPQTQVTIDNSRFYSLHGYRLSLDEDDMWGERAPYDDGHDWWARQESFMKNPSNAQRFNAWLSQFDEVRGEPLVDQAKFVEEVVNKDVRYVTDEKNKGPQDYWASPVETILSGIGDCEDYSIAKLYVLRHLGVPESRLHDVSVSKDPASRKTDHGLLLVDTSATNNGLNCLVLNNDGNGDVEILGETGYIPFFESTKDGMRKIQRVDLPPKTLDL